MGFVVHVATRMEQPSMTGNRGPATATVRERSAAATPAPLLLVDVTGKVHRPGVVQLRTGARVIDAVRAAGGALPGTSLDSLNLASKLTDGQQVAVGMSAAAAPVAADTATTAAPPRTKATTRPGRLRCCR